MSSVLNLSELALLTQVPFKLFELTGWTLQGLVLLMRTIERWLRLETLFFAHFFLFLVFIRVDCDFGLVYCTFIQVFGSFCDSIRLGWRLIRLVWLELTPFYVCFFIYTVIYLSILRCFAGPGECGFLVEISVFLFFFSDFVERLGSVRNPSLVTMKLLRVLPL